MKRSMSIKENRDFRRIYHRGKSYVSPYFVVYIAKGRPGLKRVGITAGKKIGCAVDRNRAKRVIRAGFSQIMDNIPVGYDFVIVARTRILDVKSYFVADALKKQFISAGIFCEDETVE